jgi:aminoglycoside 2''-phosphotransferase
VFEGLNEIPWVKLTHAYGSAEEVPMWLRQLASDDEQVRHQAKNHLFGSICHQGFLCHPTAYAVPYLIELLQEPSVGGKDEILDGLMWIAKADPIRERPWWLKDTDPLPKRPPLPLPLKDAYAAAEAGIPAYVALLDAPELSVRMQAASLLIRFPERARELWPILLAAFEREVTEQGQVNLAFALSELGSQLPEQRAFLVKQFQTSKNELMVFAAALGLARLEKTETPEEVVQLLARVAIEAPASLDVYEELPCEARASLFESDAVDALCNLGSARLQFLAPLLEKQLASAPRKEWTYRWESQGMLLLFIVFGEEIEAASRPPIKDVLSQQAQRHIFRLLRFLIFGEKLETSQPPRPATALTERQRTTLMVLLHQDEVWRSGGLRSLLKAYGLPWRREELAAYLGQEPPPPLWSPAPRGQSARPPRPDPITVYKAAIQAVYPDLKIRRTQGQMPDGASQEDYLLKVNDELLFRFPTQMAAVEKLEWEVPLLRTLQERLPLPIMAPKYASQGVREVGRVFVGYAILPGKPLYKEMLESLDSEKRVQRLTYELASFLYTLHHIPIAEFAHLPLPEITKRETLEALYTRVREDLFLHVPPERQAQITASFEAFLDTPENFAVPPTLIHGNFGPETILYEAKSKRISGMSGISHIGLGDPARDVGGLLGPRGYGEAFIQRFVVRYPEAAALLERAQFYAEARALEIQLQRLAASRRRAEYQTAYYPS